MSSSAKLSFDSFDPVSLEAWKEQVVQDLKGKPFEDLKWHLNEEIALEPFYGPESITSGGPLPMQAGWKIGESISVRDLDSGRSRWQEALESGVEAAILSFRNRPDRKDWASLLEDYPAERMITNLEENFPGRDPLILLERWVKWVSDQGFDKDHLAGSIDFDPILDWAEPPFGKLAEAVRLCESELPGFLCIQINARMFHGEVYAVDRELALTLAKMSEYLAQLQSYRLDPGRIAARLQLSLSVGTSYFLEMAKLRALRVLWSNLAEAYGIKGAPFPRLMAHLAFESQTEDIHQNMIRASTQAMSAVLGGADQLYVAPANASLKERSTPFTRRIARNVQHILRLEAHIGQVADPAAGSYYIEKLTQVLAEKAWGHFKQIEAEGGFMESRVF
jgi:methylmalonyl-CoA mutase